MNKRVLFGLFLGFLIAVTGFNMYAQTNASNDELQAKVKQLQANKQQILKENQELKQTLQRQHPAKIQARHRTLVDQVSAFVETAFVHSKGTYQERKKQAQSIMSDELINTFFSTETYRGKTNTSIDDVQLFIEPGNLTSNHTTVLVRFNHTLHSLQSDHKQVSKVFLEIDLQLQDGKWMVMDFREATKGGK